MLSYFAPVKTHSHKIINRGKMFMVVSYLFFLIVQIRNKVIKLLCMTYAVKPLYNGPSIKLIPPYNEKCQ